MIIFKKLFVAAALLAIIPSTGLCTEKDVKNNISSSIFKNYFDTVALAGGCLLLSGTQTFGYAKQLVKNGYKINHPKMVYGLRNTHQMKTLGALKILAGAAALASPTVLLHLEQSKADKAIDAKKQA